MTMVLPPDPSPSRFNPFARPKPPTLEHASSFTRTTLLPTLSPVKRPDGLATPLEKGSLAQSASTSAGKPRQGWRLLWRGGLEIGEDGWRLDGLTFFALLSFPSTPSVQHANPFDAPVQPFPTPDSSIPVQATASPFPCLPSADTDLCLSLESMKGRKYLSVRETIDLPEDEILEGNDDGGGVQMSVLRSKAGATPLILPRTHRSISEQSPLLASYFTSILCRNATLSKYGRTLSAVLIGLGDESLDSHNSTLIVYGQRQLGSAEGSLRICVGRRKPPPVPESVKKVRPGDPLPRAPLLFARQKKPMFRSASVSSIYHPPVKPPPVPPPEERAKGKRKPDEEDIFGTRDHTAEAGPTGRKRPKLPQRVPDNKDSIRKQTMVLLESRGCARDHASFRDVFGITTKGVYFAFRDQVEERTLEKGEIHRVINGHLDMYLRSPSIGEQDGDVGEEK
ncbi:hypothetical protein P7C73_g5971, partial [Tremellales sp. Uapishka_1]